MRVPDFLTLYQAELQEACSFETQMADALPGLAQKATDPSLKQLLEDEAAEARNHAAAITALLEARGAQPREHKDQSMQTLIGEARDWVIQIDDPALRDAALIASAQRLQHYEIAVYGSLAAWAKQQGLDEADTLLAILDEERRADAKLTEIATASVNEKAMI